MQSYLAFSCALLTIGITGLFIRRRTLLVVLMSLELILLAANTNFVAFSQMHADVTGQTFVFFVLTVAAAEVAIGLALIVLLFRSKGSTDAGLLNNLKG